MGFVEVHTICITLWSTPITVSGAYEIDRLVRNQGCMRERASRKCPVAAS